MELNTNILIGMLLVGVLILLFSKISVSVGTDTPTQIKNNVIYHPQTAQRKMSNGISSSRNITLAEAQGLPNKDDYMSNSLKKQLNDLENRFYYNNCRWEPNF